MTHSQPNILWITLDSVRADHTSLHGYERDTTPELSRIAARESGLNFEHGIAHSTRTPVSVPSMLTGLHPSRHRMIGTNSGNVLAKEMKTAPELLSNLGYRTIGVSENGYAGTAKDIDERFDDFVKSSLSSSRDLFSYQHGVSFLKYALNPREHGPGYTFNKSAHGKQSSFFTTDIAKRKLNRVSGSDEPFFCYVHYNDPHHPYIPPLSYRDKYISEIDATVEEALTFAERMNNKLYEWMAEGLPLSNREWEMLYAMYDATIKYTDACVGRLFNFVHNQFENTIVVITADHGDLFGEYGLLGHHMVLHDGLIHVPLVTHGLTGVDHHVGTPTQHIDIMKTLLSIAGADTSQFQGYDIRENSRTVAISQDLRGTVDDDEERNYDRIRKYNSSVDLSHLPKSMVTAARTTDFKLVQTDDWTKLYELPNEQEDVSNKYPSEFEDLRSFISEWMDTEGTPFEVAPGEAELTEETEEHLREMGYL